MLEFDLRTILERHMHWINEDCDGWEMMRADLSEVNLYKADLYGANLCHANLRGADLRCANLSSANLNEADLSDADLRHANLCNANMISTNLRHADLRDANLFNTVLAYADLQFTRLCSTNLHNADLHRALLQNADLRFADLRDVDLSEVSLYKADLRGAHTAYMPMICPEEGVFIGWKKACSNLREVIVKLRIPADAKRSSATTRKCRCSKAKVLAIYNLDGTEAEVKTCHSSFDINFVYEVGKTVEEPAFDDDRWAECSQGIHFFINKQEAIGYAI
jgi:hypothetical protein